MIYRGILLIAMIALTACGGGGSSDGGSSTGGTSGGGTTGGTTGGGTSGGVTPGGGGFDLDTGIGGSGGIIGDIDDFGSIIMNGLTLNTDDAEFFVEGESGGEDDLREGHYIIVAGDIPSAVAEEVVYRANLKGPVSSVTPVDALTGVYELIVLSQTVITSPSTRFDGVIAADLAVTDLVEVSGPIDESGRVLATYVGLKNTLADYKAIGRVAALDTSDESFDLGGLQVDYSSASLSEFDGAALAEGQFVEVRFASGSYVAGGGAQPVDEVELLPEAQLSEGAEIEIEGVIGDFGSATDFTVGGLSVTTDGDTEYENGSADQLSTGLRVEVEGTANADGVIVAEEIEFEDDPAIRVEGAVTVIDELAGTVTAMGLTFEIRSSTELEDDRGIADPFTLNDLALGDFIEVRGYLSGGSIIAVELEREDTPAPGEFQTLLRGPLTAIDEVGNTVDIQGVTVIEQEFITEYEDAAEDPISRADFYGLISVGVEVKAVWEDFSPANAPPSDAGPADTLSLEDDD